MHVLPVINAVPSSQANRSPTVLQSLHATGKRHCISCSFREQRWLGLRSLGKYLDLMRQPKKEARFSAVHDRGRFRQFGFRALFTGIVEETGKVMEVQQTEDGGQVMSINASTVLEDVKLGDSIAVNGTCLTVTGFDSKSFTVGLAPETLRRTSLGEARTGSPVNLERSMQPVSRMGGHIVQEHVDGTGKIVACHAEGDSLWVKIKTPPDLLRYIVPKGYIAVDGTSFTVVEVDDEASYFTFMLVAYTQQAIVNLSKSIGNKVNLEVDIFGKYVERLVKGYVKGNM